VDQAYRAKYRGSPYLDHMIGVGARSATVKIMPRETVKERKKKSEKKLRKSLRKKPKKKPSKFP
jgi:hypothetical protein